MGQFFRARRNFTYLASLFISSTFSELKLTGMQGDVMKESMTVAKTLAFSLPSTISNKIITTFEKLKNKVYISMYLKEQHQKMVLPLELQLQQLYILLTNKNKNDIAITGEICLQGKITAIGGLDLKY